MNRQPDKLFREKLHDYQKLAPAGAWQRIAGNLHAERTRFPWLKIAAAVIVLALATLLLFPFKKEAPEKNLAQQTVPSGNSDSKTATLAEKKQKTLTESAQEQRAIATSKRPPKASHKKSRAIPSSEQAPVTVEPPAELVEETATADEVPVASVDKANEEPDKKSSLQNNVSPESESPRRVTLIFSAQEVNEKYLDKKEITEATPNDKESSSLRRLLDKAYDLKHNQDPLGELRQKKNEILAFNFKNDRPQHD